MPNETDKFTRHAHYVERYKSFQVKKVDKYLRRVDKFIREQLSKAKTISSRKRLLAIQKNIRKQLTEIYSEWQQQMTLDLVEFGASETAFSAKAITGVSLGTLPSDAQLLAAIKARPYATSLLKDEYSLFKSREIKLINNTIADGFYAGRPNAEIIQAIRGTKAAAFKDGVIATTKRAARTLTRTSIQHTASVAKSLIYENNADLFTHYQWVSTLDGRTSSICQKLSGNVYEVGSGPMPPAHRNCRSTTVPVLDDELKTVDGKLARKFAKGATQASVNGQVSANLTYGQWLKQQPAAFQDSVLGKARGKLFRKNKLPLDKYIENGKPIPLDELIATKNLSLSDG